MSDVALSRVILGGILFKKGALFGTWKPRYYYLEYSAGIFKLCYKNNEDDPRSRGTIPLTSFDVMLSESEDGGKCGFIIETTDRVVLLRAATPKDRAKWVGQLTLIKEAVAPPSHTLTSMTAVACANCTATLLPTQSVRCELCNRSQCPTPPCTVYDRIGRSLCGECAAAQPDQPRDSQNAFDTRTGSEAERLLVTVAEAYIGSRPVDSYVVVKVGDYSKQSPVVTKSTNPQWALQADLSLRSQAQMLQVHVYNHDMLGFHQSLGVTSVPVGHLEDRRVYDDWFALVGGNPGARVRLLLVRAGAGASDARGLAIARLVRVLTILQVARVWETLAKAMSLQEPVLTIWIWISWCVVVVTLPVDMIPTMVFALFALIVAAGIIGDAIEGGEAYRRDTLQHASTHLANRRNAWSASAQAIIRRSVEGDPAAATGVGRQEWGRGDGGGGGGAGEVMVLRDDRGRITNDRSVLFQEKVYYEQMRQQGSHVQVFNGTGNGNGMGAGMGMGTVVEREREQDVVELIGEAQRLQQELWNPRIQDVSHGKNPNSGFYSGLSTYSGKSEFSESMRLEKKRSRNSYSSSRVRRETEGVDGNVEEEERGDAGVDDDGSSCGGADGADMGSGSGGSGGGVGDGKGGGGGGDRRGPRDWVEAFAVWVAERYGDSNRSGGSGGSGSGGGSGGGGSGSVLSVDAIASDAGASAAANAAGASMRGSGSTGYRGVRSPQRLAGLDIVNARATASPSGAKSPDKHTYTNMASSLNKTASPQKAVSPNKGQKRGSGGGAGTGAGSVGADGSVNTPTPVTSPLTSPFSSPTRLHSVAEGNELPSPKAYARRHPNPPSNTTSRAVGKGISATVEDTPSVEGGVFASASWLMQSVLARALSRSAMAGVLRDVLAYGRGVEGGEGSDKDGGGGGERVAGSRNYSGDCGGGSGRPGWEGAWEGETDGCDGADSGGKGSGVGEGWERGVSRGPRERKMAEEERWREAALSNTRINSSVGMGRSMSGEMTNHFSENLFLEKETLENPDIDGKIPNTTTFLVENPQNDTHSEKPVVGSSSSSPPIVKFSLQKHAHLVGGTASAVVTTGAHHDGAANVHVTAGAATTLPYPKRRQQTRDVLAAAMLLEIIADVLCLNADVKDGDIHKKRVDTLKLAILAVILSLVIPARVLLVALGTLWMSRQLSRYQAKEVITDRVKVAVDGGVQYNNGG